MPFIEVHVGSEQTLISTDQIVKVSKKGNQCEITTTAITGGGVSYVITTDDDYGAVYNQIKKAAGTPASVRDGI